MQTYFLVDNIQQIGYAFIQTNISILHLQCRLHRCLMIVITRIIGQRQHIGRFILSHRTTVQTLGSQQIYFIVDIRTRLQFSVFALLLVIKMIFESLLRPFRFQKTIHFHRVMWRPRHISDTEIQSFLVIIPRHPIREIRIIRSPAPFSGFIIHPESAVTGMSCRKNRSFPVGCNGIDQRIPLRSYFQFIGNGGSEQRRSGSRLIRINTHETFIFHTVHRTGAHPVNPILRYDSVNTGRRPRINSRNRGCFIYIGKIEFRILIYSSLFP